MSLMNMPLGILALAVLLLLLEFFVPSAGVLGVLSALAFVAAIAMAFVEGGANMGMLFTIATAAIVPLAIYFAAHWWPHTPIGRRMLIQPPEGDETVPQGHRERQRWIGQTGVAITPMLPCGAIRIGKRSVDAISDGMPIEVGTEVEVVAVRGYHLIVRPRLATEVGRTEIPRSEPISRAAADPPTLDAPIVDPFGSDPFDDSLS